MKKKSHPTLTKAKIVELIYESLGFSKKEAYDLLDMFFQIVKQKLKKGESVKISKFGSFIVREKKARLGRNPQTGERITISSRRVLTFRPSPVLKSQVSKKRRSHVK